MPSNIIVDGSEGHIYFTVDIFDDGLSAEIIAKDTELDNEITSLIQNKQQAVADGDNDIATLIQNKIDMKSGWRTDLGTAAGIVNEIINHRAE